MADPLQSPPGEARQGWKEIADFFGVTVRTAQLWEAERALPVRRLPGGRVFAQEQELKDWAQNGPGLSPATPTPEPGRKPHWAWALLLIPLCAALTWPWWRPVNPSAAFVQGGLLTAVDQRGHELWKAALPAPPVEISPNLLMRTPVHLVDLDGDGRNEVLVAVRAPEGQSSDELLCYSSRGELRWTRKAGGKVRTAKADLSGRYVWTNLLPWTSPSGRGLLVISVSALSFPSQVALLDSSGRTLRQYWHAGHLHPMLVADSDGDGRRELWTGGIHNPSHRAAVVVLDPEEMQGASEESSPDYQIVDQPPTREVAHVLLYRSEPSRAIAYFNAAVGIHLLGHRVAVGTKETFPGVSGRFPSLLYEFEGKGQLTSAAIVDNSVIDYTDLEAKHLIAPGAMQRDRAHLREVTWLKRWSR